MADKEERIYICKTLKTDPCEICEGSGQIECAFCKRKPMFDKSISRAEAIERMAKAICKQTNYQCSACEVGNNKEKCEEWIVFQYKTQAEAALNALFEVEK